MTRYNEDYNRKLRHEIAVEHKEVVSIEQLRDILELVKNDRWPDGNYSDHECNVWSVVREYWPKEV